MEKSFEGKRIAIAGGSGFLGLSMAEHFIENGADVSLISRTIPKSHGAWTHFAWDGRSVGDWTTAIDGCDAVVNLAGRTVNLSLIHI